MEMNIHDDTQIVEIWLTNAEKTDPVLQDELKGIYAEYKAKKYMVAVFQSGQGDMRILAICCCLIGAALPSGQFRHARRQGQ